MKKLFLALSLLVATDAFAQEAVKTCKTKLTFPGTNEVFNTNLEVVKIGASLVVKTWQQSDQGGPIKQFEDQASIEEYQIRPELIELVSRDPDNYEVIEKLNIGESLIAHALTLESNPIFEGQFRSGLELKEVRKVNAYLLGKATHMGQAAIVEAYNQAGVTMGSFFGGFIATPCL